MRAVGELYRRDLRAADPRPQAVTGELLQPQPLLVRVDGESGQDVRHAALLLHADDDVPTDRVGEGRDVGQELVLVLVCMPPASGLELDVAAFGDAVVDQGLKVGLGDPVDGEMVERHGDAGAWFQGRGGSYPIIPKSDCYCSAPAAGSHARLKIKPLRFAAITARPGLAPNSCNSYPGRMRTISSLDAKNRFGQLLEAAQRAPVTVTRKGRPAAVVLSVEDYERMRGAAWQRLLDTMTRAREEAAGRGLTGERLDELLADES